MSRIDETLPFLAVSIAVITISDTRSEATDTSGDRLQKMIEEDGHKLASRAILRDEPEEIATAVRRLVADPSVDVIITTGGTGVTGRDVTPEAVMPMLDKLIEGFGELFRWISYQKIGTSTIQSRAFGGLIDGTYIFCLPGSPGACRDAWQEILRYQLDSRHRPCNLVELMPRLKEHLKAS